MFFSHHFRTFSKKLSIFFETFSVNLTELHFTSPKDQFEDIILFWQSFCLFFFHYLPKLNGEITVFASKKQSANLSNLLTTYPRRFFEEYFFEKVLFFIIGHWATFVCHFDEILSVPMSVLLSVCQLDQFVVKKVSSNFFSP